MVKNILISVVISLTAGNIGCASHGKGNIKVIQHPLQVIEPYQDVEVTLRREGFDTWRKRGIMDREGRIYVSGERVSAENENGVISIR